MSPTPERQGVIRFAGYCGTCDRGVERNLEKKRVGMGIMDVFLSCRECGTIVLGKRNTSADAAARQAGDA